MPFFLFLSVFGCSCSDEAKKSSKQEQSPAVDTVAQDSNFYADDDGDGVSEAEGDCDDTDPNIGIIDVDQDGFSACHADCDDTDPFTYPGAAFHDSTTACMTDADEDGYGEERDGGSDCDDSDSQLIGQDVDEDGFADCLDCDDDDAFTFPGAAEKDDPSACMADADGDGYAPISDGGSDCYDGDAGLNQNDADEDGLSTCDGDCDDTNAFDMADQDGDGVTICDGDLYDNNPAIAYVSPSGPTFSNIPMEEIFDIGSPSAESGRDGDELRHSVYLTHDFLIMNTEVTQGQYAEVMGGNPSSHQDCGLECPVENITWHQAVEFANQLSERDGLMSCYSCSGETCTVIGTPYHCDGYRLPTEAEWEYAARAGSAKSFWTPDGGADLPSDNVLPSLCESLSLEDGYQLQNMAWYCGSSFPESHQVGLKLANGFGLYDMHGNVEEWTEDFYHSYSSGLVYDPYHSHGQVMVVRGGSFESQPQDLRAANRRSLYPTAKRENLGFRLVRSSPFGP